MIDLDFIDDLVQYPNGPGWVLHFSNQTFAEFFRDTINVDIDNQRWRENGASKGKRLRYFLRTAKDIYVVQILDALWDIREYELSKANVEDPMPKAHPHFKKLMSRLNGQKPTEKKDTPSPDSHWNDKLAKTYFDELVMLTSLAPHPRGFAFEKFLNRLFVDCGLSPRKPFRITGQQLDGSFDLNGDTYLLEAKWENAPQGNTPLYAFEGKVTFFGRRRSRIYSKSSSANV